MATPTTIPQPSTTTAAPSAIPQSSGSKAARRPISPAWRLLALAIVVATVAGVLYETGTVTKAGLMDTLKHLTTAETPEADPPPPAKSHSAAAWDGLVTVDADEEAAIGFGFAEVKAQNMPLKLELNGRTAYDTNTITKVRPRFDTRVEEVFAKIGQKVKQGDPLVLLSSTDLAAAKSDCQVKFVQWQHDKNLYDLRKELVKTEAISKQLWVDTQNDEQKSRLDYLLTRDKLLVTYEVPKEEIDPLLEMLSGKASDPRLFDARSEKMKLIIRAKAPGYVIKRDVNPNNYYESTDVLMEIAPLDHLWVWVNVYEIDQDKVEVGQTMQIQFLSHEQKVEGKVDYVASEVSQDTRAIKVRAEIPNPGSRLKSDMLVKAMLEIPPEKGQTVVPRQSVVSVSGVEYVFVRKFKNTTSETDKGRVVDKFERRKIEIAQENSDNAVIASGLEPGMEVATNGSIILSQLFEDQRTSMTGLPAQ